MLYLNFNPFPVLQTKRLLLRQLMPTDVNEIFFLRSDERVMQYIDRPRAQHTDEAVTYIEQINAFAKNNKSIMWAIALHENPTLIGTICFWNINSEDDRGEIGYVLHPDFHRKGIMNEAMEEILKYGFHVMRFHSVAATVNPANEASIRLLEKNKFIREAYFRENYFYNGRYMDTAIYGLLTKLPEF
jgi:ribosomal-protein-alanine N-acetyltransferase